MRLLFASAHFPLRLSTSVLHPQIYNLMKFDSYTRFLKSLLYQECMLAEVEGRPLPDPYQIPSSPTSKHSTTGSDRSNLSTPKKVNRTVRHRCRRESPLVQSALKH